MKFAPKYLRIAFLAGFLSACTTERPAAPVPSISYDSFEQPRIRVHFQERSDLIDVEAVRKLEKFASAVDPHWMAEVKLIVIGNASHEGDRAEMLALGCRRALALRSALLTILPPAGVDIRDDRIGAVSYGDAKPIDPRKTVQAYAMNRYAVVEFGDDKSLCDPSSYADAHQLP